ncbi:SDR family oxidoreductase [Urechidicola croceus]|uniref:Short-chain dehydrogenase/reductase n=1 Tax=Urechidicola croceus TaxID=1850246 RepID=A0A1D8P3T1_9FLAO|nr:SDR family oxidoreductase [Urechidicola croceus]AOW19233.1 short-chain dehydrogenase/reductase [Urechidicola croceus]
MSKVVLITGASSGIGLSIANFLTEKGYTVYGTSRSPKNIEDYTFKLIKLEVTKEDSIKKAVQSIVDAEGRLDVLINNAGKGITGAIEETPTDEMRMVFDTNFFGAIDTMKEVLPYMRQQKYGRIINITSIAGYMGLPFRGIYSATKGALELVTEATNMEVKNFGIHAINVAPGDFATKIAKGRYHTPVYNDSAYKETYQRNLDLMNEHVSDGDDPIKMAKAIYGIIESKNPKIHYKVSNFLGKLSIVLKRILPDTMFQKMLMNHYKL